MRPSLSSRIVRPAVAVVAALALLSACGGAAAPAADPHAGASAEPAEPEVSKEDFEALSTRVLELELRVKNLQAEGATGDPIASTDVEPAAEGAAPAEHVEWDYSDPTSWGQLGAAYATCATGKEQSPIDLRKGEALAADIANPVLDYGDTDAATIVDNGHTVEIGAEGAGTLALEGELYDLKQLHFHAPSEHTIDGEHAPLEIHFVHKTVEGSIAVVGVLVEPGAPAPGYDAIVRALPTAGAGAGEGAEPAFTPQPVEDPAAAPEAATTETAATPEATTAPEAAPTPIGVPLALRSLLPQQTTAYRYRGSLTTPPCSEGVSWLVLTTPLTMSQAQIDAIVSALPAPNNRPTQRLEERVVGLDVTP